MNDSEKLFLQNCCSENECNSVGSRPDIQQKLQEKKQKQLAELKQIEEEIKLGKLHRRPDSSVVELSPPPPLNKNPPDYDSPEILLAPRFLCTNSGAENEYYEWNGKLENAPVYR